MEFRTGKLFCDFLFDLPELTDLPEGVSVLNPYRDSSAKKLVQTFIEKYYSAAATRTLIMGINPGRIGGGLTGIPFTDPVALADICGIQNYFDRKRELSSRFIYRLIGKFESVNAFYNQCLLSAICPLGFVNNGKNFNYYDHPGLLKALNRFLHYSLTAHAQLGVRTDKLIVLGKKNSQFISEINRELKLFDKVVTLEHPRFILQYRSSKSEEYLEQYFSALT